MAENKKKDTAKTSSKPKTTKAKTVKTKPADVVAEQDVIEDIKKQIEAVNTEINVEYNNVDKIVETIDNELEPVNEVIEEVGKIEEKKKELEDIVAKEPAKVQEFVEKETKNAEELKGKIKKIMSSIGENRNITHWWNGSSLDF